MRVDMVRRQLSKSLMGTEFALTSEAKAAHLMQQQTRDIRYVNVPAAKFLEQVNITDDEILTYAVGTTSPDETIPISDRGYGVAHASTTESYNTVGIINSRNNEALNPTVNLLSFKS